MTKTLLETINLKKSFNHKNGIIQLFNNGVNKILQVILGPRIAA